MKRFIGFLFTLLLIFAISQNVTALVLDDVTIDENITLSKNKNDKTDRVTIRFHNYPDDISVNLRLTLNQEEIFKPDYTLNRDLITRYYYILIDNSGSMRERDLAAIRKNVSYLISHIDSHDYVEVITVSDYSSAIYNLAHYSPNVQTRIDSINREGNYSRLYDAVSELNTQVRSKQSADMKKAKHDEQQSLYYILFFSDGEDIESRITGKQMRDGYRDIPFYYFCYSSEFKPEPNKPFQEIASKHGKFFNYLDTEKIDELFFRNENRYTLIFFVNKKEVLKSKSYYIELSKRTTEEGKIIIYLRKYFDGSNLNDMIVDAPKDNTLYHNLKNNLAHDTQYSIHNSQFIIHNEGENSVTSTEAERSTDNEMLNQVQHDRNKNN
ncbi:MAG: VWA domain-containing protein [Spirochaetales bacterium]|nr:VWA domain-containing protein [Spirochaetales bacterium]